MGVHVGTEDWETEAAEAEDCETVVEDCDAVD